MMVIKGGAAVIGMRRPDVTSIIHQCLSLKLHYSLGCN